MDIRTQKIKESLLDPNDGQLEGLPSNPRKWSEEELENLKKSILETPELLEARGIIVVPNNGRYIVLGGNMRLAALRSLGWTDIPCIVLSENTPAEKLREIVIKDNGSFGEWDTSMLAADWSDLPLDSWGVDADWSVDAEAAVNDESAEEDDFDESTDIVETRCKLGELWELGAHRFMCGDSTDTQTLEALMGGVLADMYLTDPPYNVDYTGGTKDMLKIANDSMPDEKFKTFLTAAFTTANKHLKAGGAFYIWHADSEGFNFRYAIHEINEWMLKQCLIWNKNTLVLGRQDYQWKHEPCCYGWKSGAAHYFIDRRDFTTVFEDQKSIDINSMKKQELKELCARLLQTNIPTTVIDERKPSVNAEHPTMKPVRLMGRLISNSSRPGEIVLDTFGGSGTTLIACEQLGRKCRMVELDPHYCDVIIARWEKLTGEKAVKIS